MRSPLLRVPAWGSFVVTIALVGLAVGELQAQDGQAMAGAIIGYVAAYWLPARRDADE
jgi:hypothetical protein